MTPELTTSYLGLELRNPIVVAACPLTGQIDKLLRMEQAGAAAFVLPSLFEEQIEQETRSPHPQASDAETRFGQALSYFPGIDDYLTTPDAYLRQLEEVKKSVAVPLIGSLNGVTPGGWTKFASLIEQAAADALELNMYSIETDPDLSAQAVEDRYLELVQSIREAISIPLAIKVGPYFTAFANFATRLATAGADGLVVFNRFFQPDIDVDRLVVMPMLRLSESVEVRLPLRWIALLHGRVDLSLAATTGVHTGIDAVKYLLAGADIVMVASAVIQHGPDVITTILNELQAWLELREYSSVGDMRGLLDQHSCADPAAFERANYVKTLLQGISTIER